MRDLIVPGPDLDTSGDFEEPTRILVEEFFQYRPPELKPAQGHTKSTGTRSPGEFDRHLHEDLILLHLVKLPSIASDLAVIAEDALHQTTDIPPIDGNFPTIEACKKALDLSSLSRIRRESDIQEFYLATTARHCTVVAATLALQLPKWSSGCFEWTFTPIQKDTTLKSKAVADGFLNIVTTNDETSLSLSERHQEVAKTFPELVIWEFKNLLAGDRDAMNAIANDLAGCSYFPWEGCEFGTLCAVKHHKFIEKTGCKMGFDAKNHPCPCIRDAQQTPQSQDTSVPHSHPDLKNFARTPRHIVQQAWAEAVRHDSTFVVIQSGNFEIIGIRDRLKQTLYISDVIEVYNCEYGKLHTGLYIAALRDAEDRTSSLKELGPPVSWVRRFGNTMEQRARRTGDLSRLVLEQAYSRDWLVMTQEAKNQIPIPILPNSGYQRDRPTVDSIPRPSYPDIDSIFKIHIENLVDDGIARGALQIARTKKLTTDKVILKAAHGQKAIEKLHREYQVYLALHKAGVAGIAKIIGFFRHVNLEKAKSPPYLVVLVMEDRGRSVHELLESRGAPFVSRPQLNEFQKVLNQIHAAGYLRGSLTTKNLMIAGEGDSIDVAVVGFGGARHVDTVPLQDLRDMKTLEHSTLQRLLPNPLTRKFNDDSDELGQENTLDSSEILSGRELLEPARKLRRIHTY